MALSCNRRAFELDEGCPSVDIDLTFPDFDACGDANEGRLKGVSRIALQKSPAFPTFMPGADPLPVSIPDIDVEMVIDCSFDDTATSVEFSSDGVPGASGSLEFNRNDENCGVDSVRLRLDIPNGMCILGTASDVPGTIVNPFNVPEAALALYAPVSVGGMAAVWG